MCVCLCVCVNADIIITDEPPEGDYEYISLKNVPPSSVAENADNVANELRSSSPRSNVANGRRHYSLREDHVSHMRSSPPPTLPCRNVTPAAVASNVPFILPVIPTSPRLVSTTTPPTHQSAQQPRIPPPVLPRTFRTTNWIDSDPRSGYLEVADADDDEGEDRAASIDSPSSQTPSISSDCVFGEIGLVPADIASLSVEEVYDDNAHTTPRCAIICTWCHFALMKKHSQLMRSSNTCIRFHHWESREIKYQ